MDRTDPGFATVEPPPHVKLWQARQRGEEIVTQYERLWPELSRLQRRLPAIDAAARRSLEYLHDAQLKPVREYGKQLQLWKMRVELDHKTRGVEARQWYAATLPDELAWMLPVEPIGAASVVTPRRSESSGRPAVRGASRRASARSGDSGDDGESEPPSRRLCENARCEADITHRPKLARYCNDACQQEAYRDRRTIEILDEIAGTIAEGLSCTCAPRRGDTAPHNVVEHGHCTKCGYTRGVLTRAWADDEGVAARSFVRAPGRERQDFPVRPNRKLSAKLRATKNEYVDESIIRRAA